jgi:hypothetical protein
MSKSSLFQAAEEQNEKDKPFMGAITFTDKTISWVDTTILLGNVSQFKKYGVTRIYRITTIQLIIAGVAALASFAFMPYGLILLVPAAFVLYVGIKERLRSKLYGLTIELNSGSEHYFLNTDLKSINNLFEFITEVIKQGQPFSATFTFVNNGIIGDGATGNTFK